MAKKSKSKKRTVRRRRVGGIGGDPIKLLLGAAVGGIAGTIIGNKVGATVDNKIKGAAMLVLGFFAAKGSNPLIKGMGYGLAANGGLRLGTEFLPPAIMAGVGDEYYGRILSGFDDYPNNPQRNAIAGFDNYPNNPPANVISGINPGLELAAGSGLLS